MNSKRQSNVAGIILAGGLSKRIGGGDKGETLIRGKTIFARIIETLAPQVQQMAINANGDPKRFEHYGVPIVADSVGPNLGPLAGILAGLKWAEELEHSMAVVVSCDTPFLPQNLVAKLQEAGASEAGAIAASGGRIHHAIGHWRTIIHLDLEHALTDLDMRKVADWTSRVKPIIVEWPIEPFDPFFNVNTAEDIMVAERVAVENHL